MMEPHPPSQPAPVGNEAIPPDALSPPKWSLAAVAGFVLSFLLILAPLGILLGIVGIIRTWGGRRRGMGLAVAAIPIGAVVSLLVGMVLITFFVMRMNITYADRAAKVLQTSSVRVPEVAEEFYAQRSEHFRKAVSQEELERWLDEVIKTHGSLLEVKRAPRPFDLDPETKEWIVNLVGEFAQGTAHIGVVVANPRGTEVELRNISVEGNALIPARSPETSEELP